MPINNALPDTVIEAFHLMWDNFPEPASLVHKSREVIALNKAHQKLGYLQPGMNCAKQGSPEAHKGCLANKTLKFGQAAYTIMRPTADKEVIAYWLPVDGYPDFFIHFGVGNTIDYRKGSSAAKSVVILREQA